MTHTHTHTRIRKRIHHNCQSLLIRLDCEFVITLFIIAVRLITMALSRILDEIHSNTTTGRKV